MTRSGADDISRFADLSRVAPRRPLRDGDDIVPAGSIGTIVHVYDSGEAFEVEFTRPLGAVILVDRRDLEPA